MGGGQVKVSNNGIGTLKIQPKTPGATIGVGVPTSTLNLPASYFTSNFVDGFSGITIGSATAGDIAVGGAVNYNDPLTLETAGSITVSNSASLTGAAAGGDNIKSSLVLWSDAGANSNGYISLSGAINSNGGNVWLGGGAQSGTLWNGLTVGSGSAWGNGTQVNGINLYNGSSISAGTGNVWLSGTTAQTASNPIGVEIDYGGAGSASITTYSGNIDILGTSTGIGSNGAYGVLVHSGAVVASTGAGNVTIEGSGGTGSGVNTNDGVAILGAVLSNSGAISLTGIKGSGGYDISILTNGTVGYKTGTSVTASSSNISVAVDTLSVIGTLQSSGTLTIQPRTATTTIGIAGGVGTLALTETNFSANFRDGFSGITVGSGNAGDITVGATAMTYNDPLTLKTARNIQLSGATVISGAGSNPLVLWSDADGNNDGYIGLNSSSIATNGGYLWMGGGSGSTNWKGLAVGNGSAANSAGSGISLDLSTVSSGLGYIYMNGVTSANGHHGIKINNNYATSIDSTTGSITLIGAGADVGANNSDGINVSGSIHSTTGAISLTGYSSGVGSSEAIAIEKSSVSSTSGGNISLNNDVFWMDPSTGSVASGGTLTIAPTTAGRTIGIGGAGDLSLAPAYFNTGFANGFSGITIGNATAGNITVGGAATLNDNTTFIAGGNIAINAALNASGQTVTLTGGSDKTVSGNGDITATNLLLNGSGTTYTLITSIGNSVGTLAASTGSGNVSFYNNGSLTIGTVDGISGIATTGSNTGLVDIETFTGNLTVSQNITADNTSASAVILNAGRNTAASTASGGDIIISGTPTPAISTGLGGTAKLYTGSVAGSKGLTALIGSGSSHFRYASDNSASPTTNYTAPLVAGNYAIYRESFDIKVTPAAYFSTYGDAVTPTAFVVNTGNLQNGDSLTGTISATITSTGGPTSPVGGYLLTADLGLLPLRNSLGYNLVGVVNPGAHTITQRPISVTANNQSRTYGDANPTTGAVTITSGSTANGDTLSTATLTSTATSTTPAGLSAPLTPNSQTFSVGTAGNYNITYVDGTLTISQRPISVTANNQSRTYGDANPTTGAVTITSGSTANGDTLSTATLTSTATSTTPAGLSAPLTPNSQTFSVGTAGNYNITYVDGTLTISQRPISVTANNQSRTYGDANPTTGAVTITSGSTANGDALSTATLTSTATSTTPAGLSAPLTPNSQTFSVGTAGNYAITYNNGSLTISSATATISATKPYDGNTNITSGNIRISGVNGETLFLSGIGTATIASKDIAENATNYIDNFNGLSIGSGTGLASNYLLPNTSRSANNGVTLSPKTVSLSANKTYDGTTNLSGFVAIDTGIANEILSYSGATSNNPNVTTTNKFVNAISLGNGTGGKASNYQLPTLDYLNAPVTINKANLTVTADNKSRLYGETNPPLTTTVRGFVNSEDATTALGFSGAGRATTTATSTTGVGQATITASVGTLIAANYDFVPVNGTLTIQPLQSMVFTPPPPPKVDFKPLATPDTDPLPIKGLLGSATVATDTAVVGEPCKRLDRQNNQRCQPTK
jgi:hypothetical protein